MPAQETRGEEHSGPPGNRHRHAGGDGNVVGIQRHGVSAKVRPVTLAPVFSVMLVSARMSPWNDVVVPRVAEEPTCQKTLHADPELIRRPTSETPSSVPRS